MTWQRTPHCAMNLGDAFPHELEGLIGAITADLGAASRPGPAIVVAAAPHRTDGPVRTVLVTRGRSRGCRAGRRAHRLVLRARPLSAAEHGGPVGPRVGRRERGWPGGGQRRLGPRRDTAVLHRGR